MEAFLDYFNAMPSHHRTLILVGGLTFFWMIEYIIPLFTTKYNKWKHAGVNLFFTLTTAIINFSMAFVLVKSSLYVVENEFGILQWLSISLWAKIIVGLLLMDLISSYLIHLIEHKVAILWMFHIVHHTDHHVDTTTANRHHPGESVFRFIFTTLAVILLGAPMWLVFLYQTMSVVLTQFNHSNISMPSWLDESLVLLFCTPNMHRVHHHYRQPYTDCNYGNIFSIWDRVFGTFRIVDNQKLVYGVDVLMGTKPAEDIMTMLKIPFMGYRKSIDYPEEEEL